MHLPGSHPAAATGEPPAQEPEARVARKRGRPPKAHRPGPCGAWERECRPFLPGPRLASVPASGPPAVVRVDEQATGARLDAPSDCGPKCPPHAAGSGGSSEEGPACWGPALAPGPEPVPASCSWPTQQPSAADGLGGGQEGAPGQGDEPGGSGWMGWADWAGEDCGGDGCWCCGDSDEEDPGVWRWGVRGGGGPDRCPGPAGWRPDPAPNPRPTPQPYAADGLGGGQEGAPGEGDEPGGLGLMGWADWAGEDSGEDGCWSWSCLGGDGCGGCGGDGIC
jgi:hypothetical protein